VTDDGTRSYLQFILYFSVFTRQSVVVRDNYITVQYWTSTRRVQQVKYKLYCEYKCHQLKASGCRISLQLIGPPINSISSSTFHWDRGLTLLCRSLSLTLKRLQLLD